VGGETRLGCQPLLLSALAMSAHVVAIERGAFNRAHASQPAEGEWDANMAHNSEGYGSYMAAKRPPVFQSGTASLNKKPRHLQAAARPLSPKFGRDTGYICYACRAVMWDKMIREQLPVWKFCPCCGSELMMPTAQLSYSEAAQAEDRTLQEKVEALVVECKTNRASVAMATREPSKRSSVALSVRPSTDRAPAQQDLAQAGARGSAAIPPNAQLRASKLARNKPKPLLRKKRIPRPAHKKIQMMDLLSRLKLGKTQGQSCFCDVCGHRSKEVKCTSCPSSFHKICLGMKPWESVAEDWSCHTCTSRGSNTSELLQIAETARKGWKPLDTPMQCSSCGYHETEAMKCDSCTRWFCFACMCLSAATLPLKTWSCPECVGQDRYDEGRRKLIAASCRRVREEKVTAKEQDGFSQLVFDLSCTCNWDEWERNIDTLIAHAKKQLKKGEIPVVMPFHSLHYARQSNSGVATGMDKMMIRQISEAYAKHAKEEAYKSARVKLRDDGQGGEDFRVWKFDRLKFAPNDNVRRLRIGYLSSDFVDHPTADLIQSALLKHDKTRFEIFCYSISREDDSDYRKNLSEGMEHFTHFPASYNDKKCAEIIAADGIHILVNLNGHTAGDRNGISALRPAPLQLVYLAYPGTMGADYIDYNVTDKVVCPDGHRKFYTEKLLYMPHCYQTNSFRELYSDILDTSKLPSRQDHQLPEDPTFIFCNFCRLGRITPELFAVWMNILKRVPESVIWLYKHPKAAVSRLQSQAEKAGVSLERLIFGSPCSPKLEHLKRVTLANLALDTLVYNGHTTASDMLWAGVPLITMRGDNWPSLVATCIAEAAEMDELVVESLQEYEEKAVELAQQPQLLKKLRAKLAKKRKTCPLFDSDKWIGHFEIGLDEVWRRYAENDEHVVDLVVKNIIPVLSRTRLSEDMPASPSKAVRNGAHHPNSSKPACSAAAQVQTELVTTGKQPRDDIPKFKEGLKNQITGKSRQRLYHEGDANMPVEGELVASRPETEHAVLWTAAKAAEKKSGTRLLSPTALNHQTYSGRMQSHNTRPAASCLHEAVADTIESKSQVQAGPVESLGIRHKAPLAAHISMTAHIPMTHAHGGKHNGKQPLQQNVFSTVPISSVCTGVCVRAHVCVCVSVSVSVSACVCVYKWHQFCQFEQVYVCIDTYVCVCANVCMYI